MPGINEMMADLQQADAAGDAQLAQHIANLIKAAQTPQAPPLHGQLAGQPDYGDFGNAALAAGMAAAPPIN
jgi:hypothetical protein